MPQGRPRHEETQRPYRLWDSDEKKEVRWRYYSDSRRAHNAALIEVRWSKVNTTLEVYNCVTGALLGVYKRKLDHISVTRSP
jgi:hypothetical protein